MLEVLFALMILGVGLIAVASIFPVASSLQRETVDQVHSQHVGEIVKSQVNARGFDRRQLELYLIEEFPPDAASRRDWSMHQVQAFPYATLYEPVNPVPLTIEQNSTHNPQPWRIWDRVYPSVMPDPMDFPGLADDWALRRTYYWVPLVHWRHDDTWRIYVFLLRNERESTYPSLDDLANPDDGWDEEFHWAPLVRRQYGVSANAGDITMSFSTDDDFHPAIDFDVGTEFLDNYGQIHEVVLIRGNEVDLAAPVENNLNSADSYIWYGVPATDTERIPTRKILRFGSEAMR